MAQLRVVDEAMNDVPPGERSVGEVVARAPYLTLGYHEQPDASARLWSGGWMHTGDIGFFDADGYLHLVDRQKDVIKSGGEWISSIALEDLIGQHPCVREVAVIGVNDAQWGERPLALVVPREPGGVDAAALQRHLRTFSARGTISPYAVPDHYLFVDELAKTSVGKLDKKRLREQYA
jgi:fatty-acyl-CoA synthase